MGCVRLSAYIPSYPISTLVCFCLNYHPIISSRRYSLYHLLWQQDEYSIFIEVAYQNGFADDETERAVDS